MMDVTAANDISEELGCIPLCANAKSVSAAARGRLCWAGREFAKSEGESMQVTDW